VSVLLGIIEHDRGRLAETSLEMLTLAGQLARRTQATVEAVVVGASGAELARRLAAYGVERVHLAEHELVDDYAPEAWAETIVQVADSVEPAAVLAAGTDRGNEVIAHVAARTSLPMAANCTRIEPGEEWRLTRLRWGGSLLEEASLSAPTKLVTVAPHVIEPVEVDGAGDAPVEHLTPALTPHLGRTRVRERATRGEGITLATAPVVVSGGRGAGGPDGFAILEELAGLVGGAVGCSRVATNAGWRPHSDQVGQTGTRIAPDLYIACGISGAIQHWVGCMNSKKILAINTDPDAPLVARADYAVIGDLHEVVAAIIEELRARADR
jgi:electron transfer flavoprotein alpha subunit